MSGLSFHLTPEGRALLVNAANTGTNAILVTQIGLSASGAGVVGGVLSGEIKRLATFAGEVVAADTVHVTIRDESADVYSLRAFALYEQSGTLLGWYAQADVILEKGGAGDAAAVHRHRVRGSRRHHTDLRRQQLDKPAGDDGAPGRGGTRDRP